MRTPESVEKEKTKKYLRSIGAYFFSPTTRGFGASGTPDIACCIFGSFWGLELKREGKKPTAIQNLRMQEIVKAGGNVAWGTATDVIPILERWMRRRAFGSSINEIETDVHAAPLVLRSAASN